MHRHQHLRAAWLALLLFVLATLTPTVSRAMAHVHGQIAPWATLCSAAGGSGLGAPDQALKHLTDHCPACHLQAHDLAPPPADASGLPRPAAQALLPRAAFAAHAVGQPWSRGQPRAPPSGH